MLLSVNNFKSIKNVVDIDVSMLTVLAGVNSSGKSSLIQALLLLKQTLTLSSNEILTLNGPYVYANSIMDLVHNKRSGAMSFSLLLSASELEGSDIASLSPTSANLHDMLVSITLQANNDGAKITHFELNLLYVDDTYRKVELLWRPRLRQYDLYADNVWLTDIELDNYSFANFFPVFIKHKGRAFDLPIVKAARETLIKVFDKIIYIAPLRVAPVYARTFQTDVETRYVLPNGENTRYILDSISDNKELISMVKEWICDKFNLAKDLNVVKETGKRYRVVVTTNDNLKVDLMHMGFGLSQILPIITQGCIAQAHSLLIVEDPDVHMHPSIQAAMADFFIFLCHKRKVSVIVETHSDHFITRIRRRVAESNMDATDAHLIFVMNEYGESIYRSISLSDSGRIEGSMPKGFLDSLDSDFRAIIEANR